MVTILSRPQCVKYEEITYRGIWVWVNLLTPWDTKVIFKLMLVIDGWGTPYEIALPWISLDLTNDKST